MSDKRNCNCWDGGDLCLAILFFFIGFLISRFYPILSIILWLTVLTPLAIWLWTRD
jgi:hypothetical protein